MRAWMQSNSSTLKTISWPFGAKSLGVHYSAPWGHGVPPMERSVPTFDLRYSSVQTFTADPELSLWACLARRQTLRRAPFAAFSPWEHILLLRKKCWHSWWHTHDFPHSDSLDCLAPLGFTAPAFITEGITFPTTVDHIHRSRAPAQESLTFFTSSNCCWFVFCRRVTWREFSNLSSYRVKDFGRGGQNLQHLITAPVNFSSGQWTLILLLWCSLPERIQFKRLKVKV